MRTDAVKKRMLILLQLAGIVLAVILVAGGIVLAVYAKGKSQKGEAVTESTQTEAVFVEETQTSEDTETDAGTENAAEVLPPETQKVTEQETQMPEEMEQQLPPPDETAVQAFGLYLESGGTMEEAWMYLVQQNLIPEGMTMDDLLGAWEQMKEESSLTPQDGAGLQQEGVTADGTEGED